MTSRSSIGSGGRSTTIPVSPWLTVPAPVSTSTPDGLRTLLAPFKINIVYSDDDHAYKKRITESEVITGKKNTQRIEREHLSLRTWCSRLVRKGIRFSKKHRMHRNQVQNVQFYHLETISCKQLIDFTGIIIMLSTWKKIFYFCLYISQSCHFFRYSVGEQCAYSRKTFPK